MQDEDEAAFLAGADATPAPETPAPEPEKATEAAPEPEAKPEATATPPEEAETPPEDAEKPKQTPWFQKRIDELTKARWDAAREAEQLRQEIAALRQPQADADGNTVQPPADPVKIAEQIVAQREFDSTCNAIYEKGAGEFADFDQALKNFGLLGGLPRTLIEAAQETDAPHAVLYDLGKNPEEAARILSLPPIRMAAAVAKLAAKPVTPPAPRVSKAPEPVRPVGGVGRVDKDPLSDDADIDTWMKAHDKREAERRASR